MYVLGQNKKIRYTPANPVFFYIKVGFKRVYISWTCFPDALDHLTAVCSVGLSLALATCDKPSSACGSSTGVDAYSWGSPFPHHRLIGPSWGSPFPHHRLIGPFHIS